MGDSDLGSNPGRAGRILTLTGRKAWEKRGVVKMIDRSIAIEKVKTKKLYIRTDGIMAMVSDGKNAKGKWHVVDMIFGNVTQACRELRQQGYELVKI